MSEALGNRIKERRTELGLTQAELADLCLVSRKTINTVENGVFVPSTLLACGNGTCDPTESCQSCAADCCCLSPEFRPWGCCIGGEFPPIGPVPCGEITLDDPDSDPATSVALCQGSGGTFVAGRCPDSCGDPGGCCSFGTCTSEGVFGATAATDSCR